MDGDVNKNPFGIYIERIFLLMYLIRMYNNNVLIKNECTIIMF
jgi:hypothetical protein